MLLPTCETHSKWFCSVSGVCTPIRLLKNANPFLNSAMSVLFEHANALLEVVHGEEEPQITSGEAVVLPNHALDLLLIIDTALYKVEQGTVIHTSSSPVPHLFWKDASQRFKLSLPG
jgi:hypothetical protein